MKTAEQLKELKDKGIKVKEVSKYGVKATIIGEPDVNVIAGWIMEYAEKKEAQAEKTV